MAEETPIEVTAQKLIDTKLSLSEILGNNWKDNCIFSSVEAALKDEGIKSLDEGEEILPSEATTDLERFVVEANRIFSKKKYPYRAKIIYSPKPNEEKPKIIITGQLGEDNFYQITDNVNILTDKNGNLTLLWSPCNIGLVSKGD